MTEEWRPVPGWEPLYEVSDQGRVLSKSRFVNARGGALAFRAGRILQPVQKQGRYWAVTLADNEKRRQYLLHDLVAAAFLGVKPEGAMVLHEDDNKANNAASNLRYGTQRENEEDARRNGKKAKGTGHGMAKLTEIDVLLIRSAPEDNNYMAELYNVSASHIWSIRTRRCWRHI